MQKQNEDVRSHLENAAIVRKIANYMPPLAAKSTIAIIGSRWPLIRQIGSATLLAVADAKFVVTAAHVIIQAKEHNMTIGISGRPDNGITALTGNWIVTSSTSNLSKDQHDIAIYTLTSQESDQLSQGNFIRISDISFSSDLSAGYFLVCGYPGMWSSAPSEAETQIKSKLLQYGTYSYSRSVKGLNGYDPERHVLLEAKHGELFDHEGKITSFRTRSGYWADMPRDLAGISGCSVWMIGSMNAELKNWDINSARIIGVETGVFEQAGAIKITRWNAVLTLLHSAFPKLRPAIELYLS